MSFVFVALPWAKSASLYFFIFKLICLAHYLRLVFTLCICTTALSILFLNERFNVFFAFIDFYLFSHLCILPFYLIPYDCICVYMMFICMHVSNFVCQQASLYLPFYLPIFRLSICMSVSQSIDQSINLSFFLCNYLSCYLSKLAI